MLHSKATRQNHGLIIVKCRHLCLVPSLEEPTLSILLVHLPSQQRKCLTSSIRRRMERRIKLVLCSIHLWLTCQQPLPPWYLLSFRPILAPLLYHHFLHQTPVHPLLAAQGLRRLPRFFQQFFPTLLSDATSLWAQSLPVARLAAASFENASMMQDRQAVCSPPAPSEHQGIRPIV